MFVDFEGPTPTLHTCSLLLAAAVEKQHIQIVIIMYIERNGEREREWGGKGTEGESKSKETANILSHTYANERARARKPTRT